MSPAASFFIALVALTSTASALPKSHMPRGAQVGKAVYFMTNEEQNSIVALPIANDGTLSEGTVTCTGGKGDVAISGMTMEPAATDPLIGQSAVNIAGNVLSP